MKKINNNMTQEEQMDAILIETLGALGKPSLIDDVMQYAFKNNKDVEKPYALLYDLRWAQTRLRKAGITIATPAGYGNFNLWGLTEKGLRKFNG